MSKPRSPPRPTTIAMCPWDPDALNRNVAAIVYDGRRCSWVILQPSLH